VPVDLSPSNLPAPSSKPRETDVQSASTVSTDQRAHMPDASGSAIPTVKTLSKEVLVVAPARAQPAKPQRRWWNIFGTTCETQCCDTVNEGEEGVIVTHEVRYG
jgi:hypothetical protein